MTPSQRTGLSYFCYYLVSGLTGPFLSLWLVRLGYSPTQTGLLIGATACCSVFGPLLAGRLCDFFTSADRAIRACLGLACALTFALWWSRGSAWLLALTIVAASAARAPLGALYDTIAMNAAGHDAAGYGRIRLAGSLGFIAAVMAAGAWLDMGPMALFLPFWMVLAVVAFASTKFLPGAHHESAHSQGGSAAFWRGLDGRFWLWLAAMMLHWFSFGPYNYGFTLFLEEQSTPSALTGVYWGTAVGAEVVTFFAAGWFFKRLSANQVLTLAMMSAIVRWLILGTTTSPHVILAAQLLHGPAFALYYSAAMQMLAQFHRGRFCANYQGLFSTAVNGIAATLGVVLAGWLHERLPLRGVFLYMAPVELCALVVLWYGRQVFVAAPARSV